MSSHLYTAAYATRLGNLTAKSVVVRLCDQANDDGVLWASDLTIARDTEISLRVIQRMLEVFATIGLIEMKRVIVSDRNGSRKRREIHLNLAMLGVDLTEVFATAYADAQGKKAAERSREVEGDPNDGLFGEYVAATQNIHVAATQKDVAATPEHVAATQKDVAATFPPHPLIGGTTIEPPLNPQEPRACADASNEDGLTAEQQEHLDRLTAEGAKTFDGAVGSFRLYYLEENRKALAMTAAAEADAAKELELRLEYPDLETGLGKMRKRCGFAWVEGDLLGPILRQVVEDQAEMGKPFWRTLAQMAAMWELQRKQGPRLRARYGPAKFFSDGHWLDSAGWHWDHEQLKRDEAAGVGSVR